MKIEENQAPYSGDPGGGKRGFAGKLGGNGLDPSAEETKRTKITFPTVAVKEKVGWLPPRRERAKKAGGKNKETGGARKKT